MRILIADDEAIIRMGLKAMLQDMGHEVVAAAANGAEAVRLAGELQPELVILDIKMPEMDGLAAAEAITSQRALPVVMLTAYSDRDLVSRAAHLAVHAYLVKPVQPADLGTALPIAVARFAEWQAVRQEAASLRDALETREVVERAKRVLMDREHCKEAQAFAYLQATARRQRRPMRQVAQEVLDRPI
ncbi:MAG: response regulator [Chloroflexi bacterium]|nr:response regulator [Chloroflexota bacterium]